VIAACAVASISAAAWSWQNHAMLNYGDAVAHLHIARRVLDSHRPGLTQLGSVWLPLPHLLMLPFVQVYAFWANGIAGLIPSALAYIASCAGLYRLARRWLKPSAAALALAFFAINPNLLYLQTTAMTEPLFLCEMIWTSVWLVEWESSLASHPARTRKLQACIALVLVAAVYTRYDGWILALLAWGCMGSLLARRGMLRLASFWVASAFIVAAPLAWLLYNATCFGDWLFFMRGPYSAKAIEMRTATPGFPPHPGWHNPWVSELFFLKAAKMDAAAAGWGNAFMALSLFGTASAWLIARRRAFAWALLLWLPVPFYAYSIAYGSVPIFLPPWWPHSWYNTRYGMELLPALALGFGFFAQFVISAMREFKTRVSRSHWPQYATALLCVLIVLNAAQMVRERPLVYVEGTKNIDARRAYEIEIPPVVHSLLADRPDGPVLMDTSIYPEIVALIGIPLRQTINESDKEFYDAALAAPAAHAAVVVTFAGNAIDAAVHAHPEGLREVQRFTTSGQPAATIYVSDTPRTSRLNNRAARVVASLKETP